VPPSPSPEAPAAEDCFANLDALRIDPAEAMVGTIEVLTHVPVRKPGRIEFVRTHPDPSMSLATCLFRDDEEQASYLAMPQIRALLAGYLKPVLLVAAINRQGSAFIWPVPLPTDEAGNRMRPWGDSARQAADLARNTWLRMRADMDLGAYRITLAEGVLPDPIWPNRTLEDLLRIAFKDRIIAGADHPVIRKLRGLS
jgi:hypothetical protein